MLILTHVSHEKQLKEAETENPCFVCMCTCMHVWQNEVVIDVNGRADQWLEVTGYPIHFSEWKIFLKLYHMYAPVFSNTETVLFHRISLIFPLLEVPYGVSMSSGKLA